MNRWAAQQCRLDVLCLFVQMPAGKSGFLSGPFQGKSVSQPRSPRAHPERPRHRHFVRGDCAGHGLIGKMYCYL